MFDLNNIPFKQSPNYTAQPNSMKRIVIHTTMGSYGSAVSWLLSTNSQASAHYVINEDGSECTQLVRDNQVAWHTGNWDYNLSCIGIEHSWFYPDHQGPPPNALLKAGAALTASLCKKYGIIPNRGNIIRHGEIPPPNDHTDPPAPFDMDKFMAYVVQFFNGGLDHVTDTTPPRPYDPNPQGFSIGAGTLETITREGMVALTNEQFYSPNAGQAPGLTQRSFTYATRMGATFRVEAIQDQDASNKPLSTWASQIWTQVK